MAQRVMWRQVPLENKGRRGQEAGAPGCRRERGPAGGQEAGAPGRHRERGPASGLLVFSPASAARWSGHSSHALSVRNARPGSLADCLSSELTSAH